MLPDKWIVIIVFVCAASVLSVAAILSPKPVSTLASAADTIVIARGRVESSEAHSGTVVLLEVRRVLKGDAASTVTATASGVRRQQGGLDSAATSGLRTDSYGVWFLRNTESGLQLLPVSNEGELALALPAVSMEPAEFAELNPSTPEDRILVELAAVAASGVEDGGAFLVQATYGSNTSISLNVFQRLIKSSSQEVRLAGYSGLIIRGQPAALVGFEAELASMTRSSRMIGSTVLRDLAIIGIADEYRNDDPVGIDVLGRLATLGKQWPQVSEAASMALRAIHSERTLSFLTVLLDSSNSAVRFNAAFGIAAFANGLPVANSSNIANMGYLSPERVPAFSNEETMRNIPSLDAFRRDPEFYVNYWRRWAEVYMQESVR